MTAPVEEKYWDLTFNRVGQGGFSGGEWEPYTRGLAGPQGTSRKFAGATKVDLDKQITVSAKLTRLVNILT